MQSTVNPFFAWTIFLFMIFSLKQGKHIFEHHFLFPSIFILRWLFTFGDRNLRHKWQRAIFFGHGTLSASMQRLYSMLTKTKVELDHEISREMRPNNEVAGPFAIGAKDNRFDQMPRKGHGWLHSPEAWRELFLRKNFLTWHFLLPLILCHTKRKGHSSEMLVFKSG